LICQQVRELPNVSHLRHVGSAQTLHTSADVHVSLTLDEPRASGIEYIGVASDVMHIASGDKGHTNYRWAGERGKHAQRFVKPFPSPRKCRTAELVVRRSVGSRKRHIELTRLLNLVQNLWISPVSNQVARPVPASAFANQGREPLVQGRLTYKADSHMTRIPCFLVHLAVDFRVTNGVVPIEDSPLGDNGVVKNYPRIVGDFLLSDNRKPLISRHRSPTEEAGLRALQCR